MITADEARALTIAASPMLQKELGAIEVAITNMAKGKCNRAGFTIPDVDVRNFCVAELRRNGFTVEDNRHNGDTIFIEW